MNRWQMDIVVQLEAGKAYWIAGICNRYLLLSISNAVHRI
jgi:hypothetical protein